jgi:D-alanyl-D-alanine carboxypeptidase/D-alanyl-D-alanine-endopeptidase (penicillin-binding protein 4)
MHRIILNPEQQVYGTFQALWRELGGDLKGQLQTGQVAAGQKPFDIFRSQPLAELIRGMNKYSNNVMTKQLLLTLAAEKQGVPGSFAKGRAVIQEWLAAKNLIFPELIIDNGAGLSRDTRISAQSMGWLLLAAYDSPYFPELLASLPIAALDGTLQKRFRGEALTGRVRLKTGTINDVKSIAGYVMARSGRRFIITALQNYQGVHQGPGTEVQNVLLRWLFEQ